MSQGSQLYTREDLLKLGIYDLREIGREVGVPSPTTLKKEELIEYIIGIIYGGPVKKQEGYKRGRPARNKEKSYHKFVDLIERIEAPRLTSSLIEKGDEFFDEAFLYFDKLTSKVASPSSVYTNDLFSGSEITLTKGVVISVDDRLYVRKNTTLPQIQDVYLSDIHIKDYNLKEGDEIEYLPNPDGSIGQIIKVNGKFFSRMDSPNSVRASTNPEPVPYGQKFTLMSQSSNIIYAADEIERGRVVEEIEEIFDDYGFNVVKVCFDRHAPATGAIMNHRKSEFYAEIVGDEFETLSISDAMIRRAQYCASLGYKTLLVIDNLGWLASVVETLPKSLYSNFIFKISKLPRNADITVVCVTSHMPNERAQAVGGMFDHIFYSD